MKISKLGHCCLLIEEEGLRILTDPGMFSENQNTLMDIDVLLITHEHGDHYHVPSVKAIWGNNPSMRIITNKAVGALLEKEGIPYVLLEHGESHTEEGVLLEGFGETHASMLQGVIPDVQNTGYFIANKMFYPGDAFTLPDRPVEVLALPVTALWMKLSEAYEYVKTVKPAKVFPVHDALYAIPGMADRFYKGLMPALSVAYLSLNPGETIEV